MTKSEEVPPPRVIVGEVTPLRQMIDGHDMSRKKKSMGEATLIRGWGSSS